MNVQTPPPSPFGNTRKQPWVMPTVLAIHVLIFIALQQLLTSPYAPHVVQTIQAVLLAPMHEAPPEPPKSVAPPAQPKAAPTPTPVLTPIAAPTPAPIQAAAAPAPTPAAVAPAAEKATASHAPASSPAVVNANSCQKPAYPPASMRAGEEGTVTVSFLISEDGKVQDGGRVERSSGYPRLDDAALKALALCKFRPAMVDGRPQSSRTKLNYKWELGE